MLVVAVAVAVPAIARAEKPSDARHKLEEQERQLRTSQEAEKSLAADVSRIEADRQRLNQSLVEMAQAIQQGETRLTGIEGRLGALEAQEKFLRGSLAERHGSISRLLSAMQRMGRNPPPVMITRREDALLMVRSAMMLAASFPQIRGQALKLAGELNDLGRIIGETRSEVEKQRTETQRIAEQRTRLAALLEEKRQSLAERQAALDQVRREAAEIARSVNDLNELITRLDKVVARQTEAPPLRDSLAPRGAQSEARDEAAPSQEQGAQTSPERHAGLVVPPAPPKAGAPAVVLAPSDKQLASMNPGRIKPAIPFDKAKGRLPMPASGKRIIAFGDKAQTSKSNGIVIETRAGAQVTSPADGWIVFAGVFRSYGQILIINAGEGYHILLAGLSQIDVQLGQFVLAGEPVGVMSGSVREAKGKQPTNAPVLYIEFRKDGRSIDPDPWWTSGT